MVANLTEKREKKQVSATKIGLKHQAHTPKWILRLECSKKRLGDGIKREWFSRADSKIQQRSSSESYMKRLAREDKELERWLSTPGIPGGVWTMLQEKQCQQATDIESAPTPCRIGGGAFGQVFDAMYNTKQVAVKIGHCTIGAIRRERLLWVEPLLMSSAEYHAGLLNSKQHIVQFEGWGFGTGANQRFYDCCTTLQNSFGVPSKKPGVLMTQKHTTNLFVWLAERERRIGSSDTQEEKSNITERFMTHVLRGLVFLHSIGIQHRDLKPENILVSESKTGVPTFSIADLGSGAAYFGGDRSGKTRADISEMWGWQQTTLTFRAPEMVASYLRDTMIGPFEFTGLTFEAGTKMDMWSAGTSVLIYFVFI
jgi:serine/threonine protein kinase